MSEQHLELRPVLRKRRRVLWIVIAIVGGLAVLIPVVLYVALFIAFGIADKSTPTVGEAFTTAQHFYQAVEQHDYTSAYAYVDQHATLSKNGQTSVVDSPTTLAALAQASEQANGAITAYTPTDGNFEQGKSIVDMTMRVTRSGGSYDVHLRVSLTHGKWGIVSMDNL
jgi:hypothetical protein